MAATLEGLYRYCPRCGAAVTMVANRIVTCAACALTLFVNTACAAVICVLGHVVLH